jgi:DUF1365 family protein
MESALYEGWVRHTRFAEPRRGFVTRLFMLYLDLGELDRVFAGRWLWGVERARLASFRREDYYGDPSQPLDEEVRSLVEERTGKRPAGPIRLLCHPRYAGYVFNPVSLYYCFARSGGLEAVVAHVSNTPWNERHAYVLLGDGARVEACATKQFHVSPFLPMDHEYRFSFEPPGATLSARIQNTRAGERAFDAQLELARREIAGASLARALLRFPLMTAQVFAAIYWQAFQLRRLGAPEYPHPGEAAPSEATT